MELPIPLTLSLILLLQTGCGLLGSDPKEPELEPGRRDYIWEVDTLYSPPGGFVYDIWGSSPNDVWAVLGTGVNNLWHYDGSEWRVWPKRVAASFYSIYGLAQDDVWMGSSDGKIFHFDGEEWGLLYTYSPSGYINADIADIQATSPSDVYVIGYNQPEGESYWESFVLRNDGKGWNELFVTGSPIFLQRIRVAKNAKLIKASKNLDDGNDSLFIYQFNDSSLKEIISSTKSESRSISINNIDDYIYYYTGTNISRFNGTTFDGFLSVPEIGEVVRVDGRHEKDLFIHNWNTTYHYNGVDMMPILEKLPRNIFRAAVFENEVFFVIRDYNNGTNLIYHGTLPNEQEKRI